MKAIVAKVLFGSILGCLSCTDSVYAQSLTTNSEQFKIPESPILSTNFLSSNQLQLLPQIISLVDRIFTINKSDTPDFSIDQEAQFIFRDQFSLDLSQNQGLALGNSPYTHRDSQADVILGFQKTFWRGEKNQKYWGITTIEHWGNNDRPKPSLKLAKLNYAELSPTLPSGSSTLTVSGGGNQNLAQETNTSREFKQFRGGVSYHHGIWNHVTMGVGFVYEDLLIGFTQLTYNSKSFPLKTTISLLAKESKIDVRSHIRFKPVENFVLNYYHDENKDNFNANLKLIPGLTLTAAGDTQTESLSTGLKIAIHHDYLSISAKAAWDTSNNNLQWNLKSNIGGLKFVHGSSKAKNTSEIDLNLAELNTLGFQCSAFVKYESQIKQPEDKYIVWGSKLQSGEKITPDKHLWSLNLGYGSGSHGSGLIASGSVAFKPDLFLKFSYQEISATSNDTKIEFQIGSK